MTLLAPSAQEDRAVNALDLGLIPLANPALDIVGIHKFLQNKLSHHSSSEVVGGEIFSSLLWNLEWTVALWALDFPARG